MSTRVPAQVPPWARPSPQSPRALGPATAQTEPGRQPRTGAARSLPPHCAETPAAVEPASHPCGEERTMETAGRKIIPVSVSGVTWVAREIN